MQRDSATPGSPADWMRHARSDLALCASSPQAGVLREALCFHAQQAAEKALKAVLVAHGVSTPHTHNIAVLLDLVEDVETIPEAVQEADSLTDYAVLARYPGRTEPVGAADLRRARTLARRTVKWATRVIGA